MLSTGLWEHQARPADGPGFRCIYGEQYYPAWHMLSTLPMEADLGHWQGYEVGVWNLWPLNLRHLGTDAAGQNI